MLHQEILKIRLSETTFRAFGRQNDMKIGSQKVTYKREYHANCWTSFFFFGAESNLCVCFTVLESNATIKKNKNGNKFETRIINWVCPLNRW